MTNLTPLSALAARVTRIESEVDDVRSQYLLWLEAAERFQAAIAETADKLENISNDLWSIGVDPPHRDELTTIVPATIGIAPSPEGGRP